ncbi:MAG: hypothetical protein HRU78_09045 [Gammaproteobacteria bacterium]|nr:MAG: hypothetical protein HRU78_09045 [Gammaproteobacteria bacterium]
MALGPGTGSQDLSRKGSLTAHWPEADSLKGIEIVPEAVETASPDSSVFALGSRQGDRLRHNFALAVKDGTLEKSSVQLGPAADAARVMAEKQKEERRKQDENLRFVRMLQDIQDRLRGIEAGLAAKYGKNFAEDLAKRYLKKEEADRLLAIQDEEERKHQIALAIKRRVDKGEIDAPELSAPEYKEWLETHEEKRSVLEAQAQEAIADVKAGEKVEVSEQVAYKAKDLAKDNGLANTFLDASSNSIREANSGDQNLDDMFASGDSSQPKPNANKPFS